MNEQTVKLQEFNSLLQKQKSQIRLALPKHLDAERITRIILTEIRKNPKLLECTKESLLGSIMVSAQLGLEIGNHLQHAFLVPFDVKKGEHYVKECQFMIGYRGMIDLATRSGRVISLSSHAIYENDEFDFEYGLNERLRHIPTRFERGEFIGVYASAHLKDGAHQIEVMWKREIDKIKDSSKSAKSSCLPWQRHYEEIPYRKSRH